MKTSELTGAALDWAVAKCEGVVKGDSLDVGFIREGGYSPSTDWAQGGPIIERERIAVMHIADRQPDQRWDAGEEGFTPTEFRPLACGPTPLVAAMRCYVAIMMGDDVDVPKELP